MYDKLSIAFATLAGICFVSGLVILVHPDENTSQATQ